MIDVYLIALTLGAVLLLTFERASMTTVGVGLLLAVSIPGLLSVDRTAQSLAVPPILTVAALCVVGEGLSRTGVASLLARRLLRNGSSSEAIVVLKLCVVAALASAFVNNTLVVVAFLPVVTTISRTTGIFPSRMLIPLSYASILGGVCTLVGTSTNLLVSGSMERLGLAPIGMFELTPIGVVLTAIGIAYLVTLGRISLPKVPSLTAQAGAQETAEYVTEIRIVKDSPRIGQPVLSVVGDGPDDRARVVMLIRDEEAIGPPLRDYVFEAGDLVVVRGPVRELTGQLTPEELRPPGVSQSVALDEYDPRTMKFFELALTPDSAQIGRTVRQLHLERDHGAVAVAVQRSGRHTRNRVATMRLRSGDVVLAFGDERSRTSLRRSPDYHMIEGVDEVVYRTERMPHALVITAGLLLTLVTGTLDPCIAGLAAALLFVATGCLNVNQALDTIPWPILIFIGGTVALSQASGDAGTTARIGGALVDVLGGYGPPVIVAGLFIGALILTEFLSNNAMAVIMTPIAIEAARVADGDPRVFALAIAFGASASFANPLGYTTNLIVFGQGGYRVRDFLKVGIPMNLLVGTAGVIAMWVAYRP